MLARFRGQYSQVRSRASFLSFGIVSLNDWTPLRLVNVRHLRLELANFERYLLHVKVNSTCYYRPVVMKNK